MYLSKIKSRLFIPYFLLVATLSRSRLCQEPELLLHVVRQLRLVDGHEEGAAPAVAHCGRDLHDVASVHAEPEGLHVTRHLRIESPKIWIQYQKRADLVS